MDKIDLRKELKHLYNPSSRQVGIVEVPRMQFAMIDGEIEPGKSPGTSPSYQEAVEALYSVSYTLKFMSKQNKENPIDYTVMALEGLWWVEDKEFEITKPEGWRWTAMVMQPDLVNAAMFSKALDQLRKKKDLPALEKLRLEPFEEGLSMQIMHIGPYAEETPTIEKMKAFAVENGFSPIGKHHEIYLGDPRKADPAKLKTVLRQPVEKMNN